MHSSARRGRDSAVAELQLGVWVHPSSSSDRHSHEPLACPKTEDAQFITLRNPVTSRHEMPVHQ